MLSVFWTLKLSMSSLTGVGNIRKLNTFFRSLGIAHRVSCPYTHQQNGSAERKHRHIVETGLALLAHAHIPLKFWDEAFLTATYLINRLPTHVIDNKCPLERLFNTPPNYSLLRVFGCACWTNFRPYNKHKLSFRSKECVFLGYSSLHKGYKCLDPDSGRVYISRDVIFDENIFSFAKSPPSSSQSTMQPSPGPDLCTLHLDSSSIIMNNAPVQIPVPVNLLPADNLESSPTAPGPGLVPSDPAPTEGMSASAAMPIIGGHRLVSSAGHDSIAAPALGLSPLVGPLQTLLRPAQGRHRLLSP
jgi:hypothetical protein